MVALHVCQVWWTLAYKPLRTRRHESRRTLCQGRSVRACVHSVGMLCGYMPNSSYYYYLASVGIFPRKVKINEENKCLIIIVIIIIIIISSSSFVHKLTARYWYIELNWIEKCLFEKPEYKYKEDIKTMFVQCWYMLKRLYDSWFFSPYGKAFNPVFEPKHRY